jgi:hypothetical protein
MASRLVAGSTASHASSTTLTCFSARQIRGQNESGYQRTSTTSKTDGKQKEDAMGMMIIRHKVRDYGQWRPIFDGHVEMQRAAGLINPRVYHSADSNKSEIVVVFDTEDTKKAKDFAASADLKEAMIKAGVLDTPTIYFLESID